MEEETQKSEFWKLYEKLPEELKEAVFSTETGENIWKICERNNINEVSELSSLAGKTLLGVLAPSEFLKELESVLRLAPETAKKVFQEIHRYIFYPVQTELLKLYPTETMLGPSAPPSAPIAPNVPAKAKSGDSEPPKPTEKEDAYREVI